MLNDISIVVPVYRPGTHLSDLASNIKNQTGLNHSSIEILIIDGEISNQTEKFCQQNNFRYIPNPEKDPVTARFIGIKEARHDLVCFLDQDEMFESNVAIKKRVTKFDEHHDLTILFPSGYRIGKYMSTSNMYSSLYGDPFNHFLFKFPNNSERDKNILNNYHFHRVNGLISNNVLIKDSKHLLMEFGNMGCVLHRGRLIRYLGDNLNAYDIPNLFYLLLPKLNSIGILEGDAIIHYSSDNWAATRSKIRWRISNNLSLKNSNISRSSLSARSGIGEKILIQKIFFALLTIIPIWSTYSALKLVIKYRRIGFLNLIPLSYYLLFKYTYLKFRLALDPFYPVANYEI